MHVYASVRFHKSKTIIGHDISTICHARPNSLYISRNIWKKLFGSLSQNNKCVCVRSTQAFSISFCWISEFSDHISTGPTTNGTPDGVERYVFPSNKFLLNKINNRSVYTKLFIQNYATHSLARSKWKQRLDIRQKNIKLRYAARVKCWQKIKITKHTKWFCFLFLSLVQIENENWFIS